MRIATRITTTTAIVVAIAAAAYALSDLRARATERRIALEREARAIANGLKVAFESRGSVFRPPGDAELSRATGWRISAIPASRRTELPSADLSAAQLKRLRTMLEVPTISFADVEDDMFFVALPVVAGDRDADREVIGMVEVAGPRQLFDTPASDFQRSIILVVLVVLVSTVVVGTLASRFVSRPITKLLRGIDDVAKGDLSHVILSERDDEIGTIATRFNEMTFSLRESRSETQRQNEAKLALEQRLGHTEKLATIGQLAAEIAHEVGTPLNVIAGRARSIQRKAQRLPIDPETVEKNAAIVAEQTARITRIIQRLLDFTRRKVGTPDRTAVDLDQLATTTLELLAGQFASARVRTRFDRGAELPKVAGDADRLQQVLINLLLNAVQAMPEGGTLRVETGQIRRARPGLERAAEQDFVTLAVIDSGVGIPPDIKDKIFDPFYTTKQGDGGTGLGLAVCTGIVKEHDGWIDVEDAPGGGTIFRVYLPA